jgi:hypothetical protein
MLCVQVATPREAGVSLVVRAGVMAVAWMAAGLAAAAAAAAAAVPQGVWVGGLLGWERVVVGAVGAGRGEGAGQVVGAMGIAGCKGR